jgi:hypothetical protein
VQRKNRLDIFAGFVDYPLAHAAGGLELAGAVGWFFAVARVSHRASGHSLVGGAVRELARWRNVFNRLGLHKSSN